MRQRRHIVLEVFERIEIPIKLRNDGRRTGIDVHIKLLEFAIRVIRGTHTPTERFASCLSHIDARERVPFFVEAVVPVPAAFQPLDIDAFRRLIHRCSSEHHNTTRGGNPSGPGT